MVIDDDAEQCELLAQILRTSGFTNILALTDPRKALPSFRQSEPDLVLLDLNMPHINGEELLQQLVQTIPDDVYLPIVIISGEATRITTRKVLALGAHDIVAKPYDTLEVALRAKNLLQTRLLYRRLTALLAAETVVAAGPRQLARR
jgi:PleD family two-component response regulator